MIVGALLMAAGSATRMGGNKLSEQVGGIPMIVAAHRSLVAAGLPVLLVTGAYDPEVRALLPGVPWVHAQRHGDGLAASLAAGIAGVPGDWGAVLVALGDMPFIRPQTHRALASALAAGATAVRPVCRGREGNPAGFARPLFAELASLSGDQGARALLARLPVTRVEVEDPGIHQDLDTPEALARARASAALHVGVGRGQPDFD
ncbi:nucleotidyltransferase family protein [Thermaurantiacus sp.]